MNFLNQQRTRFNFLFIFMIVTLCIGVSITGCHLRSASNDQSSFQSTLFSDRLKPAQVPAQLNQPFQLKSDQVAVITPGNLKVQFLNVSNDSRCPIGVQCPWAGQATVVIRAERNGNALGDFNLILNAAAQEQPTVRFDDYSIKLVDLTPYPKQNQQVKLSEYVATLLVSR